MPPEPRISPTPRPSDELARDFGSRVLRGLFALLGAVVVLIGILMAPLPGPLGIPVIVIGLMITLRNSFKARRQFVRFQIAHPKMVLPIRRLLRRDPQILRMIWEQLLRIERSTLRKDRRFLSRLRRSFRRRR
jgi:hypothetical protein